MALHDSMSPRLIAKVLTFPPTVPSVRGTFWFSFFAYLKFRPGHVLNLRQ